VYLYAGVYVCLTPIVLVDLLGLEKLSNAFGLVLLFQGIGAVSGPIFAGLYLTYAGWLGSRVVSVLDSGAEGPGIKLQQRRCRVTVLGKLFTPVVSMFTKQRNW